MNHHFSASEKCPLESGRHQFAMGIENRAVQSHSEHSIRKITVMWKLWNQEEPSRM